jgi:hypothetical protein
MFGHLTSPADLASIVQVALTPVFFLTAIAALLNVLSTRLGRVADHVDRMTEEVETADANRSALLTVQLSYLRRRSHLVRCSSGACRNSRNRNLLCGVRLISGRPSGKGCSSDISISIWHRAPLYDRRPLGFPCRNADGKPRPPAEVTETRTK